MSNGPEWFAPKRYGFGVGLPIAWQGWAVLGLFGLAIGIALLIFGPRDLKSLAIVLPAIAGLLSVVVTTTKGGLTWRWGDRE